MRHATSAPINFLSPASARHTPAGIPVEAARHWRRASERARLRAMPDPRHTPRRHPRPLAMAVAIVAIVAIVVVVAVGVFGADWAPHREAAGAMAQAGTGEAA